MMRYGTVWHWWSKMGSGVFLMFHLCTLSRSKGKSYHSITATHLERGILAIGAGYRRQIHRVTETAKRLIGKDRVDFSRPPSASPPPHAVIGMIVGGTGRSVSISVGFPPPPYGVRLIINASTWHVVISNLHKIAFVICARSVEPRRGGVDDGSFK